MNDNRSEMYSINSGYYDLPVKEPWVCGKTLYSVITISSAVLVGVAAACFFAPWLFGNTTLTATGIMTLIESGYTCGFNVVMSCPDFISIKEIIYECIPKFQNRILFALSDKDADRIISEARVENLKSKGF